MGLGLATLVLAVAFIGWESTVRNPLVPLRIFRSRTLVGANILRALFPVGLFGTFFLGALYMQHVLGYGALRTGLAFLPQTVTVGIFSLFLTRRLVARFGTRAALVAGLSLVTVGLVLFARAPVDGGYVIDVLPVTLLIGTGAGLVFMPSATLAMANAHRDDAGIVSGLANVAIQMGAALGVAILATLSTAHTKGLLASGTTDTVALTDGYHLGFIVGAGCLLVAVAFAALVLRVTPAQTHPAATRGVAEAVPSAEAATFAGAEAA